MLKNLTRACTLVLLACAAAALASFARAEPPLVVGFVYVTPVGEAGWTYQHELGRREMARALGARVKTIAVESVSEGADAERVLRDLAGAQGAKLIFATSFGYLEPALRVAAEFPQVRFEHAGGYKTAPNLATYDARYYEARWLAGWLAGRTSRSGVAGYEAVQRLIEPADVTHLGALAAAGAIGFAGNWIAALIRTRAGRRLDSAALVADGNHARADAYVSLAVIASAATIAIGLPVADPLIGLAITLVILRITWDSWRTVRGPEHRH